MTPRIPHLGTKQSDVMEDNRAVLESEQYPCRGYTDDLGLVVSSDKGSNKLLQVIASFCG
jgi:hypothetical protein